MPPTDDRPASSPDARPADDPSAPERIASNPEPTPSADVPGVAPSPDPGPSIVREHAAQTTKFLLVGGLVFLIDAALYNLLVFWSPGTGWGQGLLHGQPLTAKIATIAFASCLTYLGNRLWTFGDRPRPDTTRSILLFILVNVIASVLQLACLGFSRYVLGLDSPLADNVAGTIIGQIVSTSFRYVTYGRWVFPRR